MMVIQNKYEIKDFVYLITDTEQYRRMVLSIKVCRIGEIVYELGLGSNNSYHYEFEISVEKNLVDAI